MTRGFTLIAWTRAAGAAAPTPTLNANIVTMTDARVARSASKSARREAAATTLTALATTTKRVEGKTRNQLACEKAAEPEPGDQERKIKADACARRMQPIDKDERRAGDERIERGRRATAPDGVAQKLPRAQQADIVPGISRGADEERLRTCLRQDAPRQHEIGDAQRRQSHQNRSPPPKAAERRADQRSNRGARGHQHIGEREAPRGLVRLRRVADDGAGEHQPRTSADSLEKARKNERLDVRGEEPGDARDREYGEADQQRRPTAKAIRRRPVDQLADGQAQNVETDRQLQSGGRRVEIPGRSRQRGHEYVHADRAAEDEQPQEPERDGALRLGFIGPPHRLRSRLSDRASARLRSRSLTVSSRRSERAKSSSDTSPRTRSRMSWETRST